MFKHTADNESETQDYQQAQNRCAAEVRAARQKFFTMEYIPDEVRASISEVIDKLLFQIRFCVRPLQSNWVVFPSFSPGISSELFAHVEILVFGASNFLFVGLSVAIWWGFEYLKHLIQILNLH